MQYNYETQDDLFSITNIIFHVSDEYGGEISIENDGLKYNKPNPLTGYMRPYCSNVTDQDKENFKLLFNLKCIEIVINDYDMNEKHKELIHKIMSYFEVIGPIETTIYNISNEPINRFNIGKTANTIFNDAIQKYIYDVYRTRIYNLNEFVAFLCSLEFNHKCLNELYDLRYSKLLDYINTLERRIVQLEQLNNHVNDNSSTNSSDTNASKNQYTSDDGRSN